MRAADPIRIYYGGEDCGDATSIEIEAFDRDAHAWRPHPAHARVPVPSCQTEEAGRLWNELRWRCAPWTGDPGDGWRPLRVFDPGVVSRCATDRLASGAPRVAIAVTSPTPGARLRATKPFVELRGRVEVDGRVGSDYDVVLLVDRSAPQPALDAQIEAARAFVRGLAPRLGAVRVALLPYPVAAQRHSEASWSSDAADLDGALARIARRPAVSASDLPDALDAALGALAGARRSARAVVVVGADGARLDRSGEPARGDPLLGAVARLGARSATLHWVALGGLAPDEPALARRALASAPGTFRRVPPQAYATPFFAAVALPVAESVSVESRAAGPPGVAATLDAQGGFAARVPVIDGANALVVRARTSDGAVAERRLDLVFDGALAETP